MASGKYWSVRHVLAVWITFICASLVITAPGVGALRFLNDPKVVLVGYFGYNVDFNCTTDDPNATVSLWHSPKRGPLTERPFTPGKLILNGQVFTLMNLVRSDGGMYACKATSESGQSIQRPFSMGRLLLGQNALPGHFVLIPSKPVTVLQGESESVTCESEGVSIVTLKWEKQADSGSYVDVPAGWVIVINDTSTNMIRAVLKITNAKFADTGVYKCIVATRNKSTYQLMAIRVVGPKPAKITYYSESSLKVNPNQTKLKITCRVTGFPEPVVTWRKDGKVIGDCAGQRDCRYVKQHDGLQIRQPRHPDDDAVFSCEARNKYGSDSKTFTVVVPAPPVLDHPVQTVIFFADSQSDPVYIPCVLLEGSPYPTFQWYYQFCLRQKRLRCVPWRAIGDRPAEFKAMNSSLQNTLRINPSHLPPRLRFRCKATNDEGSDEITFELLKRAR